MQNSLERKNQQEGEAGSWKEKQEVEERQKVPNYMVMNVNEYGNREMPDWWLGGWCLLLGRRDSS